MGRAWMGAAAALLMAGAAVAAEPKRAEAAKADIGGVWNFMTEAYGPTCRLSGTVIVAAPAADGKRPCSISAQERCAGLVVASKQVCTAERKGDALAISASIKSVEPQVSYAPDNFELTIESSARMNGMLRSYNSAPVLFFRGEAPVS